ncbi:hypothetical protein Tco_0406898, partial [Tanacetum coccineum]
CRCARTELITLDLICPSTYQLLRNSGGDSGPDLSFEKSASSEHLFSSAHYELKLRDMLEGVLVLSGLSRIWKSRVCDMMLRGADGNVMGIYDFLYLPEWTADVVIPDPTPENLVVGTPSSKIVAKAEAFQKRKASTSGATSGHVAKHTRPAYAQSSGSTTRPSLFMGDDDESDDDDACVEIPLVTPFRSAVVILFLGNQGGSSVAPAAKGSNTQESQGKGVMVDGLFATVCWDVSGDAIHMDFFHFYVGPYYATYPEDGVAGNCEFTREEWDAPYRPSFGVLTKEGEMVRVESLSNDQLTSKMSVLYCMMMSHGGELLARYRRLNQSHHEYVLSINSRLKGYEEKDAKMTGLELQVSALKKQVSRLNDKIYSSDASFTKSKEKGKERKKNIKTLTKSLDNLHTKVARLSAALNQATILEVERDEEILRLKTTPPEFLSFFWGQLQGLVPKFLASDEFSIVLGELLSLVASAGFECGLSMHRTNDEFVVVLKKMVNFMPGAHDKLAEASPFTSSLRKFTSTFGAIREMREEVLVRSGLSYVWFNKECDPVFQRVDDNAEMIIYNFMTLPSWSDAKITEESHHLSLPLLERVLSHTTASTTEGDIIPLPILDEIAKGTDEADLADLCAEIKDSLKRDEGVSMRAILAPTPRLGKRLGAPPFIAVVCASEPSHVRTSAPVSTSGHSLSLGDCLARSAFACDVEYDQILDDDFGIATRGEEIDLTLFPLAPGPYHMPYLYEGVSPPLYTREEWNGPHAPECSISCKDIFKDPDVRLLAAASSFFESRYFISPSSYFPAMSKNDMKDRICALSKNDLKDLVKTYRIPLDIHPCLPDPGFTMDRLLADAIGIYSEFLWFSGVRVPFSTFLLSVLKYFKVYMKDRICALSKNKVVSFEVVCRELNIVPTITLFCVFECLCKQGDWFFFSKCRNTEDVCMDDGPSSLKKWKNKFFLIDPTRLRKMRDEVIVRSGLSSVWFNEECDPIFRRVDDNAGRLGVIISIPCLLRIPSFFFASTTARATEGAIIPLPTPDEIAASLPDSRLVKKSKGDFTIL